MATTKVEQVFENDTPYRLEGSYFFPIPESASISDFAIYDGDKRMAAEIVEKAKARRIYNEIVRRQIDPGLLEYAGKDLFQAIVFPIEPRSTKKIELTYSQVLKSEGGTVSYRYELGSGRRIQPQPIREIAASVEINSPIDLKNIFSPSHKISVIKDGERRARLSFEGKGEDTQKDFLLYYSLSEKDFGVSLLTHREPGKDGYFLMLVSPKSNIGEQERVAKDIIFVLDTSGSMSGEKIDKAKAALKFGVESLSARDRFNIISFSGEEHLMKANLIEADGAGKQTGLKFIENLRAEGGTNINDALVAAFKQFQSGERPAMVVFLTDGLPTVGTTDVKQIVKNVDGGESRQRAAVFVRRRLRCEHQSARQTLRGQSRHQRLHRAAGRPRSQSIELLRASELSGAFGFEAGLRRRRDGFDVSAHAGRLVQKLAAGHRRTLQEQYELGDR